MAGGRITMLMQDVINEVKEISEISGYVSVVRKPFFSLAGRLTIMIPFFQEIRDVTEHASRNLYEALSSLLDHLETTRKLLQQGSKGSKIYLVLERKEIMRKYNAVVAELEKDLKRIYFEKLDHISHEVKEQAVLVLGQFDRARGKQFDAPTDNDLYEDLYFMYDKGINGVLDPEVLNGVIQALELNKPTALEQESVALSKIIVARGGDADGSIEKMFMVLKLIKDFLHKDDGSVDSSQGESLHICARQGIADIINYDNKVIPNEFLCPITLQVMEDPVFVSTGQTYERLAIQTWIQAGNGTCPKTGQFLTNTTLTPNYALRYLIVQWRETNRIDEPKGASTIAYSCTPAERKLIRICIRELETERYYYQRTGAGEIYQLTTRNAQIREAIGEAGVIPLLSKALQANDEGTQEYAMKALLNLSICPRNRKRILEAGAIPEIIDVMNSGSLKVCEDGATILLGLSMTDEIRFLIGSHEGLQAFVYLLSEGTERGQKEAATMLFNLCLLPCNIARAVKTGVVTQLISHLEKQHSPLKGDILALLDMIVSHRDVKLALLKQSITHRLILFICEGSQKNQENAASILLQLGSDDPKYLEEAQQLGIVHYLMEMQRYGSDEGKRKADQLLQKIATYMQTTERKRARIDPGCEASTSRSEPRRRARRD